MILRGAPNVEQASLFQCSFFGFSPFFQNAVAATEVDIDGCQISEALMVAAMIVVADEGCDCFLESTRQVIVFQQDAVLERLVSPLDLALGLRMIWCPSHVVHALIFEPIRQVTRDV